MSTDPPPVRRADSGKSRVQRMVQGSFTCLALVSGNKLGLVDALCKEFKDQWITAKQLADRMDMRERYVREWLCSMAAGGLLDTQSDGERFMMTGDTAEEIGRCQYELQYADLLPLFWQVADKIERCFKADGPLGTSYSDYEEFHAWMSQQSDASHTHNVLPKYVPLLGLQEKLESGIAALDIGCGHALPSRALAERFPKSEFYGMDMCAEPIAEGAAKAKSANLSNVHLSVANAECLPDDWTDKFDLVTMFDAFHDQARPDLCLVQVHRVLKAGGMLAICDTKGSSNVHEDIGEVPHCQMDYICSLYHCMPVSLNFPGGLGLGAMLGRRVEMRMMREAGFNEVKHVPMPGEPDDFYVAVK